MKVNKKLLPIKGHFFLFNAGTAPLVPYLSTYARQLGFSSATVGLIYTVLPIFGLVAKPLFGVIADRFKIQKSLFILFQIVTIVSFSAIYLIPESTTSVAVELDCDNGLAVVKSCYQEEYLIDPCKIQTVASTHEVSACHMNCDMNSPKMWQTVCEHWHMPQYCYSATDSIEYTAYVTNVTIRDECAYIAANNVTLDDLYLLFQASCELDPKTPWRLMEICEGWNADEADSCHPKTRDGDVIPSNLSFTGYLSLATTQALKECVYVEIKNITLPDGAKVSQYGKQRLWGSVGWGIFSLLTGALIDAFSDGEYKNYAVAFVLMFVFMMGYILKRLGHVNMMSLVLFAFGVRFILYSLLTNPWWVLPIEMFQGITFGMFYPTMASYAKVVSPPGTETTVQTYGGWNTFQWFGISSLIFCVIHVVVQYFLRDRAGHVGLTQELNKNGFHIFSRGYTSIIRYEQPSDMVYIMEDGTDGREDTVRVLYELFCEVSPGDHMREPYIVRKYPESYKNEEELRNVPKFTFPCQLDNTFVQHYSFVLTSVDSKYTFCFCRYDPKANTTLVLLSYLPWHDTFYKLLNSISNLLNSPQKGELNSFLEACRIRPPMDGHTIKFTSDAGTTCNLTEYFSAVDTKCMAGLWAALLHERRVAIVASKPSRLSACVQAANATLFPMSWQHIFIPILPKHLVDYLLAPMPFLIGVPASVMEFIDERLDLLNSGRGFIDEFEVECNHYAEKLGTGSGQRLKQQYRDWAKTVKKEGGAFFKNFKDKVRQGGKNMKSAVRVSSDSSDSSPSRDTPRDPRDPPQDLRIDLVSEMEQLFKNKSRRDSLPNSSHNSELSLADKAKTLAPSLPPRLPDRPPPILRYPIISTRKLIDVSDAPAPPPRAQPSVQHSHFVTNITKNSDHMSDFHTSTIQFMEGKDKAKLKLTMSTSQRKLSDAPAPLQPNGSAKHQPLSSPSRPSEPNSLPRPLARTVHIPNRGQIQESCGSTDLIKLDDSPTNLEDFDPLKCRDKNEKVETIKATDSALLHEYGLDFSQFGFGLLDYSPGQSARPDPASASASSVPRGWTTFN
ncbi:hypothetical protein MSG28_001115 [Choristoneura fumiferana]|uniref:Uncharacterized protein n=1 Tax=Choristoneura fumiferana TaxID=7141 RepID=A0ACC0K4B3_CHOFU|nr:hypothetical protein MSG28_001115 [Choristoneura fumiferana]